MWPGIRAKATIFTGLGIGLESLVLSVIVEGPGNRGSGRIWARIAGDVVLADADSFPELARRVECGWELGLCRS